MIGLLDMHDGPTRIQKNASHQRLLRGAQARAAELGLSIEVFNPLTSQLSLDRLRRFLEAPLDWMTSRYQWAESLRVRWLLLR